MDPITLVSLLYKITIFSPKINTNEDGNKINQKSRTEIIELYRSTMINKKNKEYKNFFNLLYLNYLRKYSYLNDKFLTNLYLTFSFFQVL